MKVDADPIFLSRRGRFGGGWEIGTQGVGSNGVGKGRGLVEDPIFYSFVLEAGFIGIQLRQFPFQQPHVVVCPAELPVELFGKDHEVVDLLHRHPQGRSGVPVQQKPEQAKGGNRKGKGRLSFVCGKYEAASERKIAVGVWRTRSRIW